MRYIPDYKLNIITEENFNKEINNIVVKLSEIKQTGNFAAFDGVSIYYEYFLAENSRGNIVIVHGLSEFTVKFYEFIYYALNQGFNVFIYDQRCHGKSQRLTPIRDLLHVDSFEDYVKDLSYFIDEVVLKIENKPIYLYAHSMGGAIAALYLASKNSKAEKAILSAPMFQPVVKNVSFGVARCSVGIAKVFFGKKRKFFLSKEFDPDIPFSEEKGLSRARFEFNMKLRKENPNYQSTPMSFGWVSNSLNIGKRILSPKVVGKINIPVLIISAKEDKMVNNEIQEIFNEKCKNCRLESIPKATHAILASDERILSNVMKLTFEFFS